MQEKTIRSYVRFSVISGLGASITFGSYTLFLDSLGLSLLNINLVNAIFMSARFFMEVPTGVFADHYGRKRSVLIGCAVSAAGFLLYSRATGFASAVAAELTVALGGALISGALGALAFDSLKHRGWTGSFRPVASRRLQADLLARFAGASAATTLIGKDLSRMWLFAAAGFVLAGLYCWRVMDEPYFNAKKDRSVGGYLKGIREGVGEALKNRSVLLVVGFTAVFCLATQSLNMYWPIRFRDDFGFSNRQVSVVMAAIALMLYLGCRLSARVERLARNERQALVLPQLVTAIGMMIAASNLGYYPVMLGFLVHELFRGTFEPIRESYLQHRIGDDSKRATVLSFQAMMGYLGMTIGLVGSGFIADRYPVRVAWMISGLMMLVAIPIFLNLKNGEEQPQLAEPELVTEKIKK